MRTTSISTPRVFRVFRVKIRIPKSILVKILFRISTDDRLFLFNVDFVVLIRLCSKQRGPTWVPRVLFSKSIRPWWLTSRIWFFFSNIAEINITKRLFEINSVPNQLWIWKTDSCVFFYFSRLIYIFIITNYTRFHKAELIRPSFPNL